jgi:hypothetical protein
MALTLAEAVEKLELLKQQRAVWLELVDHLSKFIDQEVSKADHVIPADGCVSQNVPQEVIEGFIHEINGNEIDPLDEEINALENRAVTETKKDAKNKPKQATANPKKRAAKKPNPKQKAAGTKGIRAVPAPARLKGGGSS